MILDLSRQNWLEMEEGSLSLIRRCSPSIEAIPWAPSPVLAFPHSRGSVYICLFQSRNRINLLFLNVITRYSGSSPGKGEERRREKEGERGRRRRESIERKRVRKSVKEKKRDEEEKGMLCILPAPLSPLSSIFERQALSSAFSRDRKFYKGFTTV